MTTTLEMPARPGAELAELKLGPSPFPGWHPGDTIRKAAEMIVVELGAFDADRPDLRPFKAALWKLLHNLDGIENPTAHVALVQHLAAEILRVFYEHRR